MNGVVLYIDDSEDNILVVQRLLKRSTNIQLRTARTGRDGIRAAIDDQPDLILLDNRLPDTNGEQVLRQLAATPAAAAIPVVILSGDSGQVTVKELLAAGAVDFLAKPFDLHQLLAILGRYLDLPARANEAARSGKMQAWTSER
jgi:CheY-like chemotaxis protein